VASFVVFCQHMHACKGALMAALHATEVAMGGMISPSRSRDGRRGMMERQADRHGVQKEILLMSRPCVKDGRTGTTAA